MGLFVYFLLAALVGVVSVALGAGVGAVLSSLQWYTCTYVFAIVYCCIYRMFFDYVECVGEFSLQDIADDLRPDAVSLGKMKHGSLCQMVTITHLHRFLPVMVKRSCVVSLEMLTQVMIAKNFDYDMTDEDVVKKMTYFLNSLHSVNFDRYRVLRGSNVVQDTKQVAFFFAKSMQQSNADLNCRMPGQDAEGPSFMDIGSVKLSFQIPVQLMLRVVSSLSGMLISVAAPLFWLALGLFAKALLCLTPILMTPIRQSMVLRNAFVQRCQMRILPLLTNLRNSFVVRSRSILSRIRQIQILPLRHGYRRLATQTVERRNYVNVSIELVVPPALPTYVTIVDVNNITS